MSDTKAKFKIITSAEELQAAYDGSYYTILGAGGEVEEWVDGYNGLLAEKEIGKPVQWLATTGGALNAYIRPLHDYDAFPFDLTVLMFPLDGLNVGKLAMFKIAMQDRWFDDIVQNIERSS